MDAAAAEVEFRHVDVVFGPHPERALELLDRKGAVALAARARERFATLLSEAEKGGAAHAAPPEHVS